MNDKSRSAVTKRSIDYNVLAKIIDGMIREYASECQCEGYPILKMCSMCGRIITLARLSHKIYQASEEAEQG